MAVNCLQNTLAAPQAMILPTPEDWRFAKEVHRRFARKAGAGHIASAFALAHLAALLREHPVGSVLEFGSGIGTMTYLVLRALPDCRMVCVERNAFCRDQFLQNIPAEDLRRVELRRYEDPLPPSAPFDLVIIDGPVKPAAHCVRDGTLCFAEGNRAGTIAKFEPNLLASGMACRLTPYLAERRVLRWRRTRLPIHRPLLKPKMKWTKTRFGFRLPRMKLKWVKMYAGLYRPRLKRMKVKGCRIGVICRKMDGEGTDPLVREPIVAPVQTPD